MPPTSSRSRRTSAEAGFTVLELTFSLLLLLVVVGALLTTFESVQRTSGFTQARAESMDEMRLAIDRVTKEARQASSIAPTSTASVLDMQTWVNGVATHVVYTASGTTLARSVGSSTAVLLRNLASTAVFAYTPAVAGAQVVTITLTVRPPRKPDTTLTLTSEVRLRNAGS